jgi:hypothetical protein
MAVLLVQTTGDLGAGHEISATGSQEDRCRYPARLSSRELEPPGRAVLGVVIDHIEAFSTGGTSDIENISKLINMSAASIAFRPEDYLRSAAR